MQLRLLCVIEILLNADFYDTASTSFYGPYAADQWLQLQDYKTLVLTVVCDGAYSDMFTVLAVSTVAQKAIQTIWPFGVTPGTHSPFTKFVMGRGVHNSKHPVYVLWTSYRGGEINHFVPLIEKHDTSVEYVVLDSADVGPSTDSQHCDTAVNNFTAGVVDPPSVDTATPVVSDSPSVNTATPAVTDNAAGTLHGSFLAMKQCINLLDACSSGNVMPDIPQGPKDDSYYLVDQTANVARENRGECRIFRDDCGAWESVRSNTYYYERATSRQLLFRRGVYCMRKNVDGKPSAVPLQPQPLECDVVTVHQYVSRLQRDVHYQRRVTRIPDNNVAALIEYLGKFPEHFCSHGNSKSGGEYVRSHPDVMERIQSACESGATKPKAVYSHLIQADNDVDKPRDLKHVQNVSTKQHKTNADKLGHIGKGNFADEMQILCSEVATNDFVQAVFITKGHAPSVVLYNNDQMKDLKRFCGKNAPESLRSVLCVDRTFNVSCLFATVTVFKNKSVLRKRSNDFPLFVGPILLHGDGQFSTYRQFFAHLHDALNSDVASTELRWNESVLTGSDEEQALVKALQYAFPGSPHLYCMIHCKDNVRQHMTKVGIPVHARERILELIFGSNGVSSATDEKLLDNKIAETMQYVNSQNMDINTYLDAKIFSKNKDKFAGHVARKVAGKKCLE